MEGSQSPQRIQEPTKSMARIKCPKCFHINPDGADRCEACKTPLPKIKIEAQAPPGQASQAAQFRKGQMLAGRYTVNSLIGRGGMGCIYKVHDNILEEEVALKTLLPQFVKDKMVVSRFFNEARIARKLAHPNIVRVHDIGSANSVVYISMEFLEGRSLRAILEHLPPGQRLPIKKTLHIINELCLALEYAHQFTVHRDIKPENVMVASDGGVKLMDFGISKLMANTRLTGASVVMGTPFYMSPEQIKNSRDVDARADIYSIGVMLYEILTGNVPTGVPKPASQLIQDVPPALDSIVARCVDPDPANRFQNAQELREALAPIYQLVLSGKDLTAFNTTRQVNPPIKKNRRLGYALLAIILLATTFSIASLEQRRRSAAVLQQEIDSVVKESAAPSAPALTPLLDFIPRLRSQAELSSTQSAETEAIFANADNRWEATQLEAKQASPDTAAMAIEAMQYYLAVLLWHEGECFVPPGNIEENGESVFVPAFLIDATEVTLRDFASFCENVESGWPFPEALKADLDAYPKTPVTLVSYYDAQAYAAFHRKRIPSSAQWSRAAYGGSQASKQFPWGEVWEEKAANTLGATEYQGPADVGAFEKDMTWCACRDMAGNVAEWTRSPAGEWPEDQPLTFGVSLIVRGGHYAEAPRSLEESSHLPYEAHQAPEVGFRCVREIPDSLAGARAVLQARS